MSHDDSDAPRSRTPAAKTGGLGDDDRDPASDSAPPTDAERAARHEQAASMPGVVSERTRFEQWTSFFRSETRSEDFEFTLRLLTWGLAVLLLVLVTALGKALAPILRPLALAVFLCYVIYPLVGWLKSRGVPATLAYAGSFAGIAAVAYGASRIITANWRVFTSRLPLYKENLRDIDEMLTEFVIELRLLPRDAQVEILYNRSLFDMIPTDTYASILSDSTGLFLTAVGMSFVVGFFMVFVFWEASRFAPRMISSFGDQTGGRVLAVSQKINDHVQRYLRIKVVVSAATAILSAIIMYAFGLDFYATLALLVFVLNFIPYVGSIAATFLPFVVGVLQFDSLWTAFWLAFCLTVLQQLMGNLIEPRLQGRGLNLSPLLILGALAFFGWLWGIIGMLVSVPLMSAIRLVLYEFDHTRPLAVFLSDLEDPEEFVSQSVSTNTGAPR